MKRIFLPFAVLFSALFLFASCLSSDEDEVTYYHDTAISAFTLGTLNQYLHTTTKYTHEDSVYKVTLTGSNYKFEINQLTNEIYNPDSLPYGVDAAHILCTITAKNSGIVILNPKTADGTQDSLVYYSSTDSIDFTNPLEIRAYSNSGQEYRSYTVKVNVHKEAADSFKWEQMTEVPAHVTALLNERTQTLSAQSWLQGPFDDSQDLLPTEDVNLLTLPLKTNAGYRQVLVGNRSTATYADDAFAVVWGQVVEESAGAEEQPWMYFTPSIDEDSRLPRMKGLQVVVYDDALLAVGGAGVGACTVDPFSDFYKSRDGGLTWQKDSTFVLPETDFDRTTEVFSLIVDEDQYLWLICTDTGQIWRGRINRLGWAELLELSP